MITKGNIPDNGQIHFFDITPPISTYIYGLSAGPYYSFKNDSGFKVPMKIFCRKSKSKYADLQSHSLSLSDVV